MAARRRIPEDEGRSAVRAWRQAADRSAVDRATVATAVRHTVTALAESAPGRSVEVRVPPFAAVQCVEGPVHTRGTPPAVIETDPQTWLAVATGETTWDDAVESGDVRVSGQRTDLSAWLPLTAAS
ncbi:sterol carrier family protein [Janibacter corallicola]|uniref:sterol carrier family protein n=1 Tax=Janibacter corallicola TaxID=415212 RepID=UPI0008297FD7|nr:sterol carrier family protein [Janibacter corallicola]